MLKYIFYIFRIVFSQISYNKTPDVAVYYAVRPLPGTFYKGHRFTALNVMIQYKTHPQRPYIWRLLFRPRHCSIYNFAELVV